MYTEVYGTIRSYAALRALNWIVIDIIIVIDNIYIYTYIYIYIHIEKIAVDIARRGLAHARPDYGATHLLNLCGYRVLTSF